MTEQQISDLLLFIVALYGERFKLNPLSKQAWTLALRHVDSYEVLQAAVIRHSQSSQWPPTPADILKHVASIAAPEIQIDATEAWGLVIQAVQRFGAYRHKEGLLSLPPHVRQVVKWFGWRELCLSENVDVVRGEFLKMYNSFTARQQQEYALPPVSEQLSALANKAVKALNE